MHFFNIGLTDHGGMRNEKIAVCLSFSSHPGCSIRQRGSVYARWMQIWTGAVDIPEKFRNTVDEVKDRLKETGAYYSGWEVTESGEIGHSGGTPNYSSRMVFSKTKKTGVLVLTNLNVAASTDSLCNGMFALVSGYTKSGIAKDVWTIFDIIFTAVSLASVITALFVIRARKRTALLVTGTVLLLTAISVCVTMPLIFGEGLREIAFVWVPLSFAGGVFLLWADVHHIGRELTSGWRSSTSA